MTPIERLDISTYTIPTDKPESDGTLEWDSTTIVIVEVSAGAECGIGYTYADKSAAALIDRKLSPIVVGRDAFQAPEIWEEMMRSVRNIGRPGIASMAISAVDGALWDLKARLVNLPLASLLGAARNAVALYGSGGFTSYSIAELESQLAGWTERGFGMVKMKVGREPDKDPDRVAAARHAIGQEPALFVDANGAFGTKQAVKISEVFDEFGVAWLEEPVSSDDLDGLRFVREHSPARIRVAAGEYGFDPYYFKNMLAAEAVDVLQIDGTRCGGITGFLKAAATADAFQMPISAHTAPAFHLHVCCAAPRVAHLEYFHDHVRIEHMIFDGIVEPVDGKLHADLSRPGNGLQIKRKDGERLAA